MTDYYFPFLFLIILITTGLSSFLSIFAKNNLCIKIAFTLSYLSILIAGMSAWITESFLFTSILLIQISGLLVTGLLKSKIYFGIVPSFAFAYTISNRLIELSTLPYYSLLLFIGICEVLIFVGIYSYLRSPKNYLMKIKIRQYFDTQSLIRK